MLGLSRAMDEHKIKPNAVSRSQKPHNSAQTTVRTTRLGGSLYRMMTLRFDGTHKSRSPVVTGSSTGRFCRESKTNFEFQPCDCSFRWKCKVVLLNFPDSETVRKISALEHARFLAEGGGGGGSHQMLELSSLLFAFLLQTCSTSETGSFQTF